MAVHQKVPRQWTPAEVVLVSEVVARCWESLERVRAARIVRENDKRFRLALASGAVTVYEQDLDLRYQWLYPLDPFPADVIGKTDMDLSPNQAGRRRSELKRQVIATGKPVRGEDRRSFTVSSNGTT